MKNEELKAENPDTQTIYIIDDEVEAKIKAAWATEKVYDNESFAGWIENPDKLWEILGASTKSVE